MMWKPTKAGVYLCGGTVVSLPPEGCTSMLMGLYHGGHTSIETRGLWRDTPDGPWSLLAPDWQPGAPTVAQLERWQWWAVVTLGGDTIIGSWTMPQYHGKRATDIATHNGRSVDLENITRSAPVQPVPGEVLWVPLEVCK